MAAQTKKAATRSRVTKQNKIITLIKKHSKFSLFVLFFGIVGVTLLVISRAETPFGSIPTGADKLVVQYSKPMVHPLKENDFSVSAPPAMLLYADGTMLCSDNHDGHAGMVVDAPATFRKRSLTASDTKTVFNKLLDLGIEKVSQTSYSTSVVEPTGTSTTVILNSTTGAYYASKPRDKSNPAFDALAAYLDQQCATTTEAYNPDDVTVETVPAPAASQPVAELSDVVSNLVPQGIDLSALGNKKVAKGLTGSSAVTLKQRIARGTSNIYRINGKLVKARLLTNVPKYEYPKPVVKKGKNSASAQGTRTVRWLYVIPADGPVRGNEQGRLNEIAGSLRDYYTRQTGKTMTVSEVSVVRGAKTAAQYKTCPSGNNCSYDWKDGRGPVTLQSLASYYNLQNEFKREGVSTNIIYQHNVSDGCIGWGGPNGSTDSTQFSFGFGATTDGGCNWDEAIHAIPAHEMGHTFGLVHTCDATLMGSCGYQKTAWPNTPLHSGQASLLASQSPYFVAPKQNPIGNLEQADCNTISGWTFDQSNPGVSLDVHIYDGAYQAGKSAVATAKANLSRADVNNAYRAQFPAIDGAQHGFSLPMPAILKDGKAHTVYVYGINVGAGDAHWVGTKAIACDPGPANDDAFLKINIVGAPGAVRIDSGPRAFSDSEPRHHVGRCTNADYYFTVNGSITCSGFQLGPVSLSPQSFSGYSLKWSGCDGLSSSGNSCWMRFYDAGTKTVTLTYAQSTTTSPPPQTSGVAIRGVGSNRCIDVPTQNFNSGVQVQLWDCNGTIAQKWTQLSNKSIQTSNNKCLDIPQQNFNDGVQVQLWDCNGTAAQTWSVYSDGTIRIGPNNSKCLDASGGGTASGTKLIIYSCHGGTNQQWNGLSVNIGATSPPPPPTATDPNANFSFTMAVQGYKTAAYAESDKVIKYLPNVRNISFDWGSGTPLAGTQPDWYLVGWSGTFTAPGSGTYTFYSEQDDAFALQLNSSNAPFTIDAWNGPWNGKPQATAQGSANLTAGQKVPILVYFTEFTGSARVKLYWSGPGITGRPLFPNLK